MSTVKADALTAVTSGANISITGSGSGKVALGDGTLIFPDADGSANQIIKTDGSANLSFTTAGLTGITDNATEAAIVISSDEEVTMPLQPCFLVTNSVNDSNVTGNGATVTIDFDSEIFDQGGDFAADTFTAPVGGKYLLSWSIGLSGLTATAGVLIRLDVITSNRTYYRQIKLYTANQIDPFDISGSVIADMDASDTVILNMVNTGEASDVHDIQGNSRVTCFSGCLLA
jgi:hypothetical protein